MKRVIQIVTLLMLVVVTASADGPGGTPTGDGGARLAAVSRAR